MKNETSVQPKLDDLLAGYLGRQAHAMEAGLASFDPGAEVLPFEAGPVQPVDAQRAWEETLAVVRLFKSDKIATKVPPQWPELVSSHEPVLALACAIGNFPQLVRNFHMILQKADLTELRPTQGRTVPANDLLAWAEKQQHFPQRLLAVGALRLAKQFAEAGRYLDAHDGEVPTEWRAAWDNEKAALAWHQGKAADALKLWNKQPASAAVLFNRGMAELFLGNAQAAQKSLAEAARLFADDSAWQHLAQLYLTLAQARG